MRVSDKEKIVKIMKDNCLHAYLATCDGDQPFVRPVSPIIEDDMTIWVTTFCTSRKVRHVQDNPRICLAFVEQPSGDKAAVVFGKAHMVPDLEMKRRVWNLASFDLTQHFPEAPDCREFGLLRIIPERVQWRDSWEAGNKIYKPI